MSSKIRLRDIGDVPNGRHPYGEAIEWEEVRSMRFALPRREGGHAPDSGMDAAFAMDTVAAWTNTMPAEFDPIVNSGPFREAMDGLAMREVVEPDVFRHFFANAVVG